MSYFFGAFASVDNTYYDSQELILRASKIFLFYFCATLTINDAKKLKYFSTVLVITTVYLIYWANLQYFIENWGQFNSGRLMGPKTGGSIYGDENAFGMIFVAGLPFVYYLGFMADRRWLRYALWGTIPFGLHALFLTGSRGALLGLGVAVAIIIFQSRRKYFALFLIPLMIYFFQWQGGSVMKERSGTIASFEGESSAESRIDAWRAGAKMIADHPVAGVGIGHFMMAIPYYSESQPRIAHNTLVQYTAESGLGAGLCYLIIAYTVITSYLKINMWCKEQDKSEYVQHLYCINNATTTSFIGLFVCSMFLTLNYYEIYYYLLVINSALSQLCKSLSYKNSDMAKLIHNSI
jgi:O-antigen ligase